MAQLDHQGHCSVFRVAVARGLDWLGAGVVVYVLNYTTHSMSPENIHWLN